MSQMEKGHTFKFLQQNLAYSLYRPFHKEYLYFDKIFNNSVYQMPKLFPAGQENLVIAVTGVGSTKPFSALITNTLPDLELISKSQCFPLYYYEGTVKKGTYTDQGILTTPAFTAPKTRKDAISDVALESFHKKYNTKSISKEDIFFYVYGLLHSPEYKERYASDLKKMLPHIPFVKNLDAFQIFNRAGRELAKWHLNYETIEPFPESSPCFVREVHMHPANAPSPSYYINASAGQQDANAQQDANSEQMAARVKQGGHNIPEDVVRRRFSAGLNNFHNFYKKLFDNWKLYDNSSSPAILLESRG